MKNALNSYTVSLGSFWNHRGEGYLFGPNNQNGGRGRHLIMWTLSDNLLFHKILASPFHSSHCLPSSEIISS